jgi:hypothetical protein
VTDRYAAHLLRALAAGERIGIDVPIDGHEANRATCERILTETKAGFVIAVERCGQTADGRYLNMRGADISRAYGKARCSL